MILFGLEAFAARRRTAQKDLEDALHPLVEDSVDRHQNTSGWDDLLSLVSRLYDETYAVEAGGRSTGMPLKFRETLRTTLRKTKDRDETTVERITVWLATAILSKATIDAATADTEELFLEWVDMNDGQVRHAHHAAAGQVRPIGEKFQVGGEEMDGPGDPTVPIELWINCRCTLRPVLASETLTAGGTVDDIDQTEGTGATDLGPIPWHGVLAPEDIKSGDGRKFAAGALRFRPLPLPLTWQKVSADGHNGNVTVAMIESIVRVGGEMRAAGHFLQSVPEADETIGLLGEFGRFGVSVDADDSTFELDEDEETVTFTDARVCSACIVPIPAFAEAWAALGEPPEGFLGGEDVVTDGEEVEVPDEALVASGALYLENAVKQFESSVLNFKDLAPGKTEDGPGWLTHPVDTDRLRDYWVRGPGAAKINWGTPGDFNRCRINVAEYVKPQYLNGYCANRHYDALGFWPGRPVSGDTVPFAAEAMDLESTAPAEAVNIVASVFHTAPANWFQDQKLSEPTHFTITDEGQVYGHVATWGECHIGFRGACVTPPHSKTAYANFLTGQVALDDGTRARTGPISLGGGHASPRLGLRAAVEHYDRTSAAVCDVTCGEDDHGIWVAGWLRPGVDPNTATALLASDISGDWRGPDPEHMEMVAVLAVNTGGFTTKRPVAAASQGHVSLVAAGMIHRDEPQEPVSFDVETLAEKVAEALERRQQNRERLAVLQARIQKAGD